MEPRIPYTKPSITDLEVRYATSSGTVNGSPQRTFGALSFQSTKTPPVISATASQ